jgi:hypothetical protein
MKEDFIAMPVTENSSHFHFKRKRDMKKAMMTNFNSYDTFSYASKKWGGKIPDLEMLKKLHVYDN